MDDYPPPTLHVCKLLYGRRRAWDGVNSKALFSFKKFYKIGIVPLSFVFDKYYPIMYYLD